MWTQQKSESKQREEAVLMEKDIVAEVGDLLHEDEMR